MRSERLIRYAAVLLLVLVAMGYIFVRFPTEREDTSTLLDFSEFYAAGDIVRHGLGNTLYDLRVQAEFQLRVAPVHAFYLRPPFEALLFVPLSYLGYRSAYIIWSLFSLALLSLAARLIQTNSNIIEALLQYTRGIPADYGLLLLLFLSFEPTMNCFLIGQDSVMILMVYTLVFLALKRGRELEAGGLLACGLFKFHLVLPFLMIFALRRRGRFIRGFATIAVLLVGVCVLLCGTRVIVTYPQMFLNPEYRKLMGFQPEYAANFRGLVFLLTGGKLPVTPSAILVAFVSALLLWVIAKKWNDNELDVSFSAATVATLLTGFHLFVYDLSLLLLPVCLVCGELAKRKALLRSTTLNATLFVLFVPLVHHLLIVSHLYALMSVVLLTLLMVMLGVIIQRPTGRAVDERLSREAAL